MRRKEVWTAPPWPVDFHMAPPLDLMIGSQPSSWHLKPHDVIASRVGAVANAASQRPPGGQVNKGRTTD
jgi:hypothetical protein